MKLKMKYYWTILVNLKGLEIYQLVIKFERLILDLEMLMIMKPILTLLIKILNMKVQFSSDKFIK